MRAVAASYARSCEPTLRAMHVNIQAMRGNMRVIESRTVLKWVQLDHR